MGLARELAQRIAALRFSDLSEQAVYWSRIAMLDTIGVMLAGSVEEAPRIVDEALESPSGGNALIFGTSRRARALDAALINGTAAHVLDFDNTVSTMGGHVSATMVPALIAAGDAHDSSGRDLLLAHAAGFETARIGLALNPRHSEIGWHPTATIGIFAVTAACAHLMRLNAEQTERALAMSASLAAGIKANFGTMTKSLHAGQCARGGVMAATLAKKGFTANPAAFEHKQGFFKLFSGGEPVREAAVLDGWGKPFDIESPGASYKLYPCCYSTHAAVQAALDIVRQHGAIAADSIAKIESQTPARGLAHTDRPRPTTSLEAKFSVQYCITRALLEGRVMLRHFEGEAHADPVVCRVLEKVTSTAYTGPAFNPDDPYDAVVRVTLTDGRVLQTKVDRPLGRTTGNPIPREALEAKFIDCASRVLAPAGAETLCRTIMDMEQLQSTRRLTALCEVKTPAKTPARVAEHSIH
jgi:2-methylcitrate dehydratase PrpD